MAADKDKGEPKAKLDEEKSPPFGRGLPSITQAREERGRRRRPTARIVMWLVLVFAVIGIIQWKFSQGELEEQKQALMAKQRAAESELGKKWFPLRESIEGWTLELGKSAGEEHIDESGLADWDFQRMPGLYLRLAVEQASSVEAIREHAKESARDGFAACLLTIENAPGLEGPECKRTRDCAPGLVCNEAQRCAEPTQPYNLRIAYRTLDVLNEHWVNEVQDASTDLRVKLLSQVFDDAVQHDFPIAAELLTRAKYFLLVLDERPVTEEGLDRTDGTAYPARIGIWRLEDGKNVVRIRRTVEGGLRGVRALDPAVEGARNRQVNSCALAHELRRLIGDASVPSLPSVVPNLDGGADGSDDDDAPRDPDAPNDADTPEGEGDGSAVDDNATGEAAGGAAGD